MKTYKLKELKIAEERNMKNLISSFGGDVQKLLDTAYLTLKSSGKKPPYTIAQVANLAYKIQGN